MRKQVALRGGRAAPARDGATCEAVAETRAYAKENCATHRNRPAATPRSSPRKTIDRKVPQRRRYSAPPPTFSRECTSQSRRISTPGVFFAFFVVWGKVVRRKGKGREEAKEEERGARRSGEKSEKWGGGDLPKSVSSEPNRHSGNSGTTDTGERNAASSAATMTNPIAQDLTPLFIEKIVWEKMYEPVKPAPIAPAATLATPTVFSSRSKSRAPSEEEAIAATSRQLEGFF